MSFFGLLKPNIQKLKAKGNIVELVKALDYEKDHIVRANAAYALGELRASAAVEPLLAKLNDEREVCESAVSALGKIGDRRAVEPLLLLAEDPNFDFRMTVAEALGRIKDPRGISAIVNVIKDHRSILDSNIKKKCVDALVSIGEEYVEALIPNLKSSSSWGIGFLQDALVRLDKKAVEPLIQALRTDDHTIRYNAINVLVKIGDQRAIQPLAELKEQLTDDDLRQKVTWALERLEASSAGISNIEKKVLEKILEMRREGARSGNFILSSASSVRLTDKSPQDQRDAAKSLSRKGYLKQVFAIGGPAGELNYELTPLGEKLVQELT